jgi:hypothetical protein
MTMNADTPTDDRRNDRNLHPDDHRHAGYAPAGWEVYEEKNTNHIVFTHEQAEILCHVEADGLSPLVSIHRNGNVVTLSPESFKAGLEEARAVMSLCSMFITDSHAKE